MSSASEYIKSKFSWSGLSLLVIVVALIWSMFNIKLWKVGQQNLENTHAIVWKSDNLAPEPRTVINHDVTNYYCYLPAAFIYKDLSFNFIKDEYHNFGGKNMFWPVPVEGKENAYVIKMSMGMSYLYLPFFLMAHTYTKHYSDYPADGYSPPYEFFIILSCIFYLILGFYFLRKLLLLFFKDGVVAVVLLLTIFGTNLYYYASSEPGMSHAFSFSLFAIFAYLSVKWIDKKSWKQAVGIGLIGGLIVLIRPVNILVFLFPLLVKIESWDDFKQRLTWFVEEYKQILIIALGGFLMILPQLIFWKVNSGSWVYYSYTDEHFFFNDPHILDGLFSYRKGWLLYTPIMIFPIIGIIMSYFRRKELFWPLAIYLPLHIYIIYSWWCWWYGGSFGSRPMIEAYALLALPLGVWVNWVREHVTGIVNFSIIAVLLVSLNLFQTARYRYGSIHFDGMTEEAYWLNFGKRDPVPGFWETIQSPDYDKAKLGVEEL